MTLMKLYIVGERSPDPTQWSPDSEWQLIIAEDEAGAREMAGAVEWDDPCPVTEIPMDRPLRLFGMPDV